MEPRTKIEREVNRMLAWLPDIPEDDLQKLTDAALNYKTFVNKHGRLTCMACGHSYNIMPNDGKCPHCGRALNLEKSNKYTQRTGAYICYSHMVNEDWQVFRYYKVAAWCKRGRKPNLDVLECWQKWIRSDGQWVLAARNRGMSWYSDQWSRCSSISIKNKKLRSYYGYYGACYLTWEGAAILIKDMFPIGIRNGFTVSCSEHGISEWNLLKGLLTAPLVETLYKQQRYELVKEIIEVGMSRVQLNALKIALRHRYEIPNIKLWCDTIKMLNELNMDYRNPKYVCPDDLRGFHDQLNNRLMEIRRRENERRERERKIKEALESKQDAENYAKRINKFSGLDITDGTIHIQPLMSVEEFVEEAEEMKHCVLSAKYYNKESSLILSAKVNGKRAETIEMSLKGFKVLQCFGKYNKFTPFHDAILNLMRENVPVIQQRLSQRKKVAEAV